LKENKILKMFDLKNRNIVITGSAGLLGSQYALTLSKAGANVILVDLDKKRNQKLMENIKSKYHTKPKSYNIDVTSKDEILNLKDDVLKNYDHIYGLINNVAFTAKASKVEKIEKFSSDFEDFPLDIWKKSMDVNLTSVFLCSQIFGREMLKNKKGVIVNIASTYGLVGADQRIYGNSKINSPSSYAATKGAIINLTRYLAAYWHRKNIRVNTLSPGGVKDETYQKASFIKSYSDKTILGRMAKKTEYNGAILFLMSDASSYMTGSNLIVDGGWTAW
jgi:NAD(P)-dependent dehydrogenase (short-subunit alcohol dehydrogenase family)|tara:strand:+ start:1289 stop:2119 length:831 start_codon:yes stop_codon:yes gene_type:complete